jgi:hypothetical protein
MEGIREVGRHFILYEVKEVGLVPMGCVQINQLVAPLNLHLSLLLHFLALILMAFFPCFFQSSAVFGELDRVSIIQCRHLLYYLIYFFSLPPVENLMLLPILLIYYLSWIP